MKKARVIKILTKTEVAELNQDRKNNPIAFYTDYTDTFLEHMAEYIHGGRVWRVNIQGDTRGGKSECAQTICFLYIQVFNKVFKKNAFYDKSLKKKLKNSDVLLQELKFTVDDIHANQSDYLYSMRQKAHDKNLIFGQISQIDEARELEGGLGSLTEYSELRNINNIIAKFCPSEIWIHPKKWISMNAPYGMIAYKRDDKRKENWLKCYKMTSTPYGDIPVFVGWVCLPLHPYKKHRQKYEEKKNVWIGGEIQGNISPRMILRHKISEKLAQNSKFAKMNEKGKFVLNTREQKAILEIMIIKGEIQSFNEEEKRDIISLARSVIKGGEDE